ERRPNELLTQATRTRYRPYTAGIVAVQNNTQLPNPDAYPAGTLAVTSGAVQSSRQGIYVRTNTTKDWHNLLVGEPQPLSTLNGWASVGARARSTPYGTLLFGRLNGVNSNNSRNIAVLPEGMAPTTDRVVLAGATGGAISSSRLEVRTDGTVSLRLQA